MADDAINIGLSEEGHAVLQGLRDAGYFPEMTDAYRFGIALAIVRGTCAPETTKFRSNWNIGSMDPDGSIRALITEFFPDEADRPYSLAERLAEAGVTELGELHNAGSLRFSDLFAEIGVIGSGSSLHTNERRGTGDLSIA